MFSNIQKKIDEMKNGSTVPFKRFLEDISVSKEDYIKAVQSTLNAQKYI